ncbi:MAG: hypothetical protein GY835_11280 [bacterium]|nr:hypothetical protein [bacterium]
MSEAMSKTKTVALRDATLDELLYFANTVLGLNAPKNSKEDNLRGKIMMAHDGDITVPPDLSEALPSETATPATSVRAMKPGSSKDDPRVLLNISKGEKEGEERPIPVGVNGVVMLVPRGEDVEIPWRYFLAIKAAVKTVHTQNTKTGDMDSRDMPSYPYSVLRMPPQEDIDAWHEREAQEAAQAQKQAEKQAEKRAAVA